MSLENEGRRIIIKQKMIEYIQNSTDQTRIILITQNNNGGQLTISHHGCDLIEQVGMLQLVLKNALDGVHKQ